MPKLKNAQHEEFCQQWIIEFNGAKAARDSGYSAKTARVQASQLLTKPNIQARIAELLKNRSERTQITQDMVVQELALLGFSDFTDYAKFIKNEGLIMQSTEDVKGIRPGATRAIKSMKQVDTKEGGSISIKLHSKERPLELLGKHLGMFEEAGDKLAKVIYEVSEKFMPSILKKNAKPK